MHDMTWLLSFAKLSPSNHDRTIGGEETTSECNVKERVSGLIVHFLIRFERAAGTNRHLRDELLGPFLAARVAPANRELFAFDLVDTQQFLADRATALTSTSMDMGLVLGSMVTSPFWPPSRPSSVQKILPSSMKTPSLRSPASCLAAGLRSDQFPVPLQLLGLGRGIVAAILILGIRPAVSGRQEANEHAKNDPTCHGRTPSL